MFKAKYPHAIRSSVSFKTGKRLDRMAKEKDVSFSKVVRGIIDNYFELNPSEGIPINALRK